MRFRLSVALLTISSLIWAAPSPDPVRELLMGQVADWNKGDVTAFVQSYAEDCTFVGKEVTEGRAAVEERYRRNYPNGAAMGKLAFNNLKIKHIGENVAIVTGTFALERTSEGGGNKSGIFSLVLQRRNHVWQIVLDHTS